MEGVSSVNAFKPTQKALGQNNFKSYLLFTRENLYLKHALFLSVN